MVLNSGKFYLKLAVIEHHNMFLKYQLDDAVSFFSWVGSQGVFTVMIWLNTNPSLPHPYYFNTPFPHVTDFCWSDEFVLKRRILWVEKEWLLWGSEGTLILLQPGIFNILKRCHFLKNWIKLAQNWTIPDVPYFKYSFYTGFSSTQNSNEWDRSIQLRHSFDLFSKISLSKFINK